jgi:hypothetical protein
VLRCESVEVGPEVVLGEADRPREEPGAERRPGDDPDAVLTRGGEYCFMPSLRALRWLAELET